MTRVTAWICTLLLLALPAAAEPVDYQGVWSAAPAGSESGWRLKLTQSRSDIFAYWTTGSSKSGYLSRWSVTAVQTEPNTFTGWLYVDVDMDYRPAVPKATNPILRKPLSRVRFVFTDHDNGTLTFLGITYQISRLPGTIHP